MLVKKMVRMSRRLTMPQPSSWQVMMVWVYDFRTNKHFTPKQNPLRRADFEEFIELFKPGAMHKRKPTWSPEKPDERWRCFEYDELIKRDKLSLDIFWIKDESVEDSSTLPDPDVLAQEIVDDLENALEQFSAIAGALKAKP